MMDRDNPLIAVTPGDITGIGPEILVKVITEGPPENCRLLVVGDAGVLRASFAALGKKFDLPVFQKIEAAAASGARVMMLDLAQGGRELLALARPHPEAGRMAAEALVQSAKWAREGKVDAVVFGPLVKETLYLGRKKYNDETEMMREQLAAPLMKSIAKIGGIFRVTIAEHVPLQRIPEFITRENVLEAIEILREALTMYGVKSPRIAVAALNPHAGEGGLVGREEIDHIAPAIGEAKKKGIDVYGPVPADTVYVRAFQGQFDGVVNMYHDQANIAMKMAGFGEIVIIFARSPVIITTPSHGPAYGKAGKGTADPGNLRATIEVAASLARHRPVR
ncbi:MAG: 4-hydroxythreonine-4-phosphate dehydrogenase [Chloroflexi bacterium]|nr:4-hydroxythreonine-4-phosphate dehydrogenase [Chloroflexota bacterium]